MMSNQRRYSLMDRLCLSMDDALRTITDNPRVVTRNYPAEQILIDSTLSLEEKKHSAACMRVNHAGEVAAQGLYHGQSVFARSSILRAHLAEAALEEGDHLFWCRRRLDELKSHKSLLTFFWYTGSFMIGLIAAAVGDKWSLGFIAETEIQVMKHIDAHLQKISLNDRSSRKILEQMQIDEAAHRDHAIQQGAASLPFFIKKIMTLTAKIMVKTAYWV